LREIFPQVFFPQDSSVGGVGCGSSEDDDDDDRGCSCGGVTDCLHVSTEGRKEEALHLKTDGTTLLDVFGKI